MHRLILLAVALAALHAGPAAGAPLTWSSPVLVDHAAPFGTNHVPTDVACASESLCVAVDATGAAVTSANPASGSPSWSLPSKIATDGLTAIACPSTTLCVAVNAKGELVRTTEPGAASPWSPPVIPMGIPLVDVACPSAAFCVALDRAGGALVSKNPRATDPTWTNVDPPAGFSPATGLGCPAPQLCVAVNSVGQFIRSTSLDTGTPAWSAPADVVPPDAGVDIFGLACPATTYCAAVGSAGDVYSTDPSVAGTPVWTAADVTDAALRSIWCTATSFCITAGTGGRALVSTNPAAAAPVWTSRPAGAKTLSAVTCATAALCVALTTAAPEVQVSKSLLAAAPSWTRLAAISGSSALTSVDCPDESLCLAVDDAGHVVSALDPTWAAPAWRVHDVAGVFAGVSCGSPSFCVAVTKAGRAAFSADAGSAAPTWTLQTVAASTFQDVACTATRFCMAVTAQNQVFTATMPAGAGAPVWSVPAPVNDAGNPTSVACPTASQCAVAAASGHVLATSNAGAATPAWTATMIGSAPLDIACPTADLCLAADFEAKVHNSSNPFAAAPAWGASGDKPGTRVSCGSATFCATGGDRSVSLATAPPTWSAPAPVLGPADAVITSVSCPSESLCAAVNGEGKAVLGVAAPLSVAPPALSGTAAIGQVLTVASDWTARPRITTQWERCASGACAAIAGATGTTYAVAAADVGHRVRATQTAATSGGSAGPLSSAVSAIVPAPAVATPTPAPPTPTVPPPFSSEAIRTLLRQTLTNLFTSSFTAPAAGRLVIRWYSLKNRKKKAVLLASFRVDFRVPGKKKVVMKVNRAGRKILKKGKRVKIIAKATFTPLAGKPVTVTKKLTVKR